jgi:hypothetical protein
MKTTLFILAAAVSTVSAQTWFTGDKTRSHTTSIENGYLIEKAPIKILSPPRIDSLSVEWGRIVGRWQIFLRSENVLPEEYKPCRFTLGDWHSVTYGAGDKDGGSFLLLSLKSYEHAIEVRDALTKQLKLSKKQVSTESKETEKERKKYNK